MNFSSRARLAGALVCLVGTAALMTGWCQNPPQQPQPSQPAKPSDPAPAKPVQDQAKPEQQPPAPSKPNPFENVPQAPPPGQQAPAPAQPGQSNPQLEAPKPTSEVAPPAGNVIESIDFRGARRVPPDTLRAMIFSKKGDVYSEDTLHRDFMALWNTGRFDDIRLETEPGKTGMIVRFVLTERRVVRTINYQNMKSVTVSEVLDRFKERKVGL